MMIAPPNLSPHAPDANASLWSSERWRASLLELSKQYRSTQPVPHIYLPDFLVREAAEALEEEFPRPDSHAWTHYQH